MEEVKLTQFSHGAGCGCKISPAVLETMLHSDSPAVPHASLLVGNESRDDAAVYDLGDGTCVISTTDFFMPIVDDAFTFGAIASVNAISDVFAMGGKPLMAIAILGWPVNKIRADVARYVLEGSRHICNKLNIPLAGGHSIDSPEPIFGLAVTGKLKKENLKKNDTAREGAKLYLTKPLGIGIVTTAQKRGIVKKEHLQKAIDTMLTINTPGEHFGKCAWVQALTDVTGFGLLGHLTEMCEGSGLSAVIDFSRVPVFDFLDEYIDQNSIPGGTNRNWESYGGKIKLHSDRQKAILADPQTSGGLLVAVDADHATDFEDLCKSLQLALKPFGTMVARKEIRIEVLG